MHPSAGLDAFTARNNEEFVRIGVHWERQREKLARLRAGMRTRLSATPLFDGARFMPAYEATLQQAAAQIRSSHRP